MNTKLKIPMVAITVALLAGCASQPLKVPAVTKSNYQVLGEGEGKATGVLLFGFIPIGQNERFVTAYDRAVKSKGGDGLLDPEIQENWFWAWVLDGFSTRVKGTVIKYQQQ